MQLFCRSGAVAVVSALLSAASAHGAVICVDPGDPACQATVQGGVNAAAAGDTVEIASGLYFEAVTIPAGKDGLILTGKGTIDPHSVMPDPNEPFPPAIMVESANVTIAGLSIQNGNANGIHGTALASGLKITKVTVRGPHDDCIGVDADNAAISACVLNGCGGRAIDIAGNNAVLTKNKVDNCDSDCILVEGTGARVEGNKVTLALADCVQVRGDGATVSKNNIANCGSDGVEVVGDNAILTSNKTRAADRGVVVQGDQASVSKNKVIGTESDGFRIRCAPCTGGMIIKNKVDVVIGDDDCFSISADGTDPNEPNEPSTPSGLIIEGNSASTCADAGFEVFGHSITLRNNTAKKSGGDEGEEGFDIRGTAHTLEGNKSISNFSHGFRLEGDDLTLTGNAATGNLGDGFGLDDFFGEGGGHTLTGNIAKANLGQGFAFPIPDPNNPPDPSTLTENTGSGNRTDYCADFVGNVLTDNSFGSTAMECKSFE